MKKLSVLALSCLLLGSCCSKVANTYELIPYPNHLTPRSGSFAVAGAAFAADEKMDEPTRAIVADFAARMAEVAGTQAEVAYSAAPEEGGFCFRVDETLPAEHYALEVTQAGATLRASSLPGFIYGIQTLKQLLPAAVYGGEAAPSDKWEIPCVSIEDAPRFGYRGLHLDVARHFFDTKQVEKVIDMMVVHKLNTLHWHLTEDQGWRIEIKRYPKLTEFGSKRKGTMIEKQWGSCDNVPYGGYYTQDEIREVVAYAAKRHIAVIPEIEMPGHATAALAAYPELACGHGPKSFETSGRWGVLDDVFCPGKEQTFEFLEGMLDEVLELFPSKLIHIGGDECPRVRWKECPDCRARMEDEGIEDEAGLQTYLTLRIGRHLEAKGRRLIGWDEILDGELAPGAVVMSWRGTRGGIAAARRRHEVIMTPSTYLYFDKKATDSYDEPVSLSSSLLPLEKIYGYDPDEGIAPEDRRYLLGVQANLWTEFIRTEGRASFQLLPRIYALAEIAWSPVERKSWREFSEVRLPAHLARIDASGEPYRLPAPLGIEDGTSEGESFSFVIRPPFPGCKVRYTLNGAVPQDFDREMPEKFDIAVPRGEQRTLRCVTIAPSGRRSTVTTLVLTNRMQTNNPE